MFIKIFRPYGLFRRLPVAERTHMDLSLQLRFTDLVTSLAACPDDAERHALLLEKATLNSTARRVELALKDLEAALALPSISEAMRLEAIYVRSKVYRHWAHYAEAGDDLRQVLEAGEAPPALRTRAGLQLGRVDLDRGRFRDAIDILSRTLSDPDIPTRNRLQGCYDLVFAYISEGLNDDAEAALDGISSDSANEELVRASTAYYRGWIALKRRQADRAESLLDEARRIFAHYDEPDVLACIELSLACVDFDRSELDACIARCDRAHLVWRTQRADVHLAITLLRARALLISGRLSEALGEYRRAEGWASKALRPDFVCAALDGTADVHSALGEGALAVAALETSNTLRREVGDQLHEAIGYTSLGAAYSQAGRYREALAAFDTARQIADVLKNRYALARVAVEEAKLHLQRGEPSRAWEAACKAHELYQSMGNVGHQARTLMFKAQIRSLQDDAAGAELFYQEALTLVEGHPTRILKAEILASRAESRADQGDADGAQRDLQAARELVERTGSTYLAEFLKRRAEEFREREFAKGILSRYVDSRVVSRLLASGPRRLADNVQQEATILFSDIRGYSTMAEHLTAAETVELLNEHFDAMSEEVLQHGGMIDKFIGDAIMVVFGEPGKPRPDDGRRAVMAARGMIERREKMNREREALGLPPVRIGVGIESGPVVMGNIGSSRQVGYTVIGDPVNVASRLEGLTREYQHPILISGSTRAHLGEDIPVVSLGFSHVKGREEPVEVFAVDVSHGDATEVRQQASEILA